MKKIITKNEQFLLNETVFDKFYTYFCNLHTNIKNGIPFYREWIVDVPLEFCPGGPASWTLQYCVLRVNLVIR